MSHNCTWNSSLKQYISAFFALLVLSILQIIIFIPSSAVSATTPLQTIRVVTDNNYPPYVFLNHDGMLQGILVDQWRLWQKKTGIQVEIVAMPWEEAQKSMKSGEFDVIDTTFKTEERLGWLEFGTPYTRIEVQAFFKNQISGITDMQSLKGFVVAVKKGDAVIELLRRNGVENLVFYTGYEEIVQAAREHKVNVFVIDKPPALYFLYKYGIEKQFNVSLPFSDGEFHRAVKKGHSLMLEQIESGFSRISPDELQQIDKKWYGAPLLSPPSVGYLLVGSGVLWLLLLLFFFWNRSLRGAVKKRLFELEVNRQELTRTKDMLDESEERLRFLVQNSSDSLVIVNADGSQRYVSPAAERITGFPVAELQGRALDTIIHQDDMAAVIAAWNEAVAHPEKTVTVQYRHIHKTREWVHSEAIAQSFLAEPSINGVIASVRDVTAHKNAEEALKLSQRRLRLFLDASPDMYFLKDISMRYLMVNQANARFFGRSEADILGRTDAELMLEEAARQCSATDLRVMQEKQTIVSIEEVAGRIYEALKLPVLIDGEVSGVVGIIRDITDRERAAEDNKKLQSQLTQAQKMESVGRLAGGVAHDFNNMLSVILGHTELALSDMDASQPFFAGLQEISKAAKRSADLTQQLLAFARKQTVAPKVLNLNEKVEGMLKMLRRLIGEDIDLTWLPGSNLGPVKIDPTQIDQMLANLCVNARDAIADTGWVTIKTDTAAFDAAYCATHVDFLPGEYVMLAVSDSGSGIDAETMAKLFEPFFTTKEMGKGTGLGLATVYGIVKQNNGFINIASTPGQGTTFSIYLPRHTAGDEGIPESDAPWPLASGHETILLVEDEEMILDVTRTMLSLQGYHVLAALTPAEALRLAREHGDHISLLMTDVVMPEMNGRELAKNILTLCPNLKSLFMSGYTADVIAHRGVLDEDVHFIQKPFAIKDLCAKIREVLDSSPRQAIFEN